MKKTIYFLGVVSVFTAITAFAPPPAIVTKFYEVACGPFNDFNSCNEENITTTGCTRLDIRFVQNGNRLSSSGHFTGYLNGIGDQGNTYKVNLNFNQNDNVSLINGQAEFDHVFTFLYVSKGGAPNFVVHETFHITYNAGGIITVVKSRISGECRG